MRSKTTTWFLLAIAALLVGSAALVLALRHGFSARDEPTTMEARRAARMRRFAIPGEASHMDNPVPPSAQVLGEAKAHFADHCAQCHGNDGKGKTEIGRNLYPKAPDMTAAPTQSLTDGEIFYIIRNGIRLTGMPAWGKEDGSDDVETWRLVRFIRHLPDLTPEDIQEMEQMNPRSPMALRQLEEERRFLEGQDVIDAAPHGAH